MVSRTGDDHQNPVPQINEVHCDLKTLPQWSALNSQIRKIENESSWIDRYGWDWAHIIGALLMVPGCLRMLATGTLFQQAVAFVILGLAHCTLANKAGHVSAHNGLCDSNRWGDFWCRFFVEFIGGYSAQMGIHSHIKMHHPHTNIIGLGDSSIWKVPQLSRIQYMFFGPLLLPILTPVFALQQLIQNKAWSEIPKFLVVAGAGISLHVYVLVTSCGFSIFSSVLFLFSYRAVMSVSYIHINIFQHIGLPMYSRDHRPARIYQMATGVLNLHSVKLLDMTMGHSLISCHVEHHLFPRLSDNMCLKVKPVVQKFLQDNELPYNEDSYYNRLCIFLKNYDELMVNAPPITHFIGVQ